MQVDSLTFILISELSVGLLVAIVIVLVWTLRRKNREQAAVQNFIERLKETEDERIDALKQRLKASTRASEEQLAQTLEEFSLQEKTLYKQVIEVFLHRNLDSVFSIDTRVKAITEPFCKLLSDSKGVDESVLHDLRKARQLLEEQTNRTKQLRFEANQLAEQLNSALETLDEVSSEYSKMFGESKNAEELELSQKRILNVFRQAEMKVKQISLNKNDGSATEET
jgi:MFS superfamily sulfate permease-like transporter